MPGNFADETAVVALIVPGIGNSGPQHWQTRGSDNILTWQRVQQRDADRPVCDEWLPGSMTRSVASCRHRC